jgi:hypothetical protein
MHAFKPNPPMPGAIPAPNTVLGGDGFYVSYNPDPRDYGSDTTALVVGQMERFYVLVGDHRAQYAELVDHGFDACLAYFQGHLDQAHRFSDKLP